jgi:1-deoxy-D-xylulose-5-phosphate reductoisomerase
MPRNIAVLGSTGSIGRQTLDIARSMADRVSVFGLAAHTSIETLRRQVAEFSPTIVSLSGVQRDLEGFDGAGVLFGDDGMIELVCRPEVDLVVVGTSGRAGLLPTLAALRAGKLVALANKETLVMAGSIIRSEVKSGPGSLVPIDSEHSAIWQCLQGEPHHSIERLTLTASGGALRHVELQELDAVTPEQALRHPNWSMGPKITIDSANLMNKGLEVIEARWLFDVPLDRVGVVMHAESIVHSLVTFDDGATKAQLGLPDMRLPIQYALSHPDRWQNDLPRLDLADTGSLSFAPVDLLRFPALRLAIQAGKDGGTYPAVLSAADEVAVQAFMDHRIKFTDLPRIVDAVLQRHDNCPSPGLDDILESDAWARLVAEDIVAQA